MLLIGFRHFHLLPGSSQRGLGGFYLRLGCSVFGGGVVEFLLGDQARPRFVGVDQADSVGVQSHIVGFGTGYVALSALNFFLGMMHRCFRRIDLGHQFGDLQDSEHLSLADAVANIDVNVADVAGDLGVQFDVLIGNELSSDRKSGGHGLALDRSDGSVGDIFPGVWRAAGVAFATGARPLGKHDCGDDTQNRDGDRE